MINYHVHGEMRERNDAPYSHSAQMRKFLAEQIRLLSLVDSSFARLRSSEYQDILDDYPAPAPRRVDSNRQGARFSESARSIAADRRTHSRGAWDKKTGHRPTQKKQQKGKKETT